MQALILAAGMGKRLGELTHNNTKCMVEVNGVKLIDRVILQLLHFNIKRLVLVIGYEGKKLRSYVSDKYHKKLELVFIENTVYDKTNNIYSLYLARHELIKDETILLESDLIFEDSVLELAINSTYHDLALVAKYETWMDGTMVRIDSDNNILNFVPKKAFRYADIDFYHKTVNIYKFSVEFSANQYIPLLEAYSKIVGNNEYYEQVLRLLILMDKTSLKALPIEKGKWYEIDDIQDLDIASTLFSDGVTKYQQYHKRYGGFWRFPQLLDYCYLVNPFFPPTRMIDELKSNFEILLREYPSGMEVNSLLAAKYFRINQEFVVVGNGAAELIKVIMEDNPNAKFGICFPTFDEYPNRLNPDQIISYLPSNENYSYSVDDLISFYSVNTPNYILLINPDNPSGNFIPKREVMRFAKWCKELNINLIVDESFVDFTDDYENNSLLDNEILKDNANLLVMKSISKSYGVPGLRLGICASSNTGLVAKMKKEVSIWNINSFGEFYMQIFGKYEQDYHKACRLFIEERKSFYNDLQQIDYLRVIPSQANYFLCEVIKKFTSTELTQKLIEHDVIISNCSLKRNVADGKQLIRLAIRSREDNMKLIDILCKYNG